MWNFLLTSLECGLHVGCTCRPHLLGTERISHNFLLERSLLFFFRMKNLTQGACKTDDKHILLLYRLKCMFFQVNNSCTDMLPWIFSSRSQFIPLLILLHMLLFGKDKGFQFSISVLLFWGVGEEAGLRRKLRSTVMSFKKCLAAVDYFQYKRCCISNLRHQSLFSHEWIFCPAAVCKVNKLIGIRQSFSLTFSCLQPFVSKSS